PGTTYIPEIDISIEARLYSKEQDCNPRALPQSEALLDFDKLPRDIFVRRRLAGDVFHPYGQASALKLKDFFIKQKIPREERDRIPLICTPQEIIWVAGVRPGEKWKIGGSTKRMLHMKVNPGKPSLLL
ncbi:MAG: tRNA lysidine(34) synthetase TilS, partial [Firmicutes bacterium]|nr:tRNA lysidine(34) synthetase TilS [Bacillota bacterium]